MLHGPASGHDWTDDDAETWAAMTEERDAGRTRVLGVSNMSLAQLEQMYEVGAAAPSLVQNRCFARRGWDRRVRAFCAERRIVYQGFSLLTANPEVLRHPLVAGIAAREHATPAQVVFRFAQAVGLVFSLVGLAGFLTGLTLVGLIATGFALAAALLNAVFGFCLGCEMYLLIRRATG